PAGEVDEHFGCFAEAEIATPAPQIGGQLRYGRLDADALCPSRDLPNSCFKPVYGLGRNDALDLRAGTKAEPEELSLPWSRHRALRLIHLELEPLRAESCDTLHHPLTRPLAANVDVAVVRVTNETMSPALQLPVEFVEHEVA